MQKLRSLEMLRGIAALLVVLFHARIILGISTDAPSVARLFTSGFRGVDLFFVLSGFIIAHVHASDLGRPWRVGNYVFNRAVRIYPAVWIITLLAATLSALGCGIADDAIKPGLWNAAASVLLLPQHGDPILNVAWSLKYEVFFYAIFAGLIVDLRIGLAVLGIWQAAVFITAIYPDFGAFGLGAFYLRAICLEFTIGLACAWLIRQRGFVAALQAPAAQWAILAAGVAIFIAGMTGETRAHATDAACALGAGGIILGLVLLERSDRIPVPNTLVLLGSASYSTYLVHYSAMSLLVASWSRVRHIPPGDTAYLLAVGFAVAAGAAFHYGIDQPIQHWLRKWLKPALLAPGANPFLRREDHALHDA